MRRLTITEKKALVFGIATFAFLSMLVAVNAAKSTCSASDLAGAAQFNALPEGNLKNCLGWHVLQPICASLEEVSISLGAKIDMVVNTDVFGKIDPCQKAASFLANLGVTGQKACEALLESSGYSPKKG